MDLTNNGLSWKTDGSIVYLKHPDQEQRLFELNVITAFQSKNFAERMKFAEDIASLLTYVDQQLLQNEVEKLNDNS